MTGTTGNQWHITIEDAGNDEVLIPFPDEVLDQLGWKIGDELHVVSIKLGEMILSKTPPANEKRIPMTTNVERSRTVLQTMEFLDELVKRSDLPEDVPQEAKRLLRHFPTARALEIEAKATEKFCPDYGIFSSKDALDPRLEALFEKMKNRDPL